MANKVELKLEEGTRGNHSLWTFTLTSGKSSIYTSDRTLSGALIKLSTSLTRQSAGSVWHELGLTKGNDIYIISSQLGFSSVLNEAIGALDGKVTYRPDDALAMARERIDDLTQALTSLVTAVEKFDGVVSDRKPPNNDTENL